MKSKVCNVLEYVLVLWIIFEYFTVYMRLIPDVYTYSIGVFILSLLLFVSNKTYKSAISSSFVFYLFTILFLALFNPRITLFCLIYLIILPLFYLYFKDNGEYSNSKRDIGWLKKYCNIVTIIAIVSLVFWMGTNVLNIFEPNGIIPNNWGEHLSFLNSYYYIYFETQEVLLFGVPLQRNTAIFTEGPVCNLIFCFALAIDLFILQRKVKWRCIILIAAIITTFSTTGQLFLVFVFFIYVFFHMKRSTIRRFLLFFMPLIIYAVNIGVTMIIEDKSEGSSYTSRGEHIESLIKFGLANPITGSGLLTYKGGVSNSLFHLFAEGGIVLLSLYLYYVIIKPFKSYLCTKNSSYLLLNLAFSFLFVFTVAYYKCLDLAIIAYSMSHTKNQLLNYE